jgi:hypothetical protein
MKKFFLVFLVFGITTGTYAEFKTSIIFDFAPTLFRMELPTGDFRKAMLTETELDHTSPINEVLEVERFNDLYRGINYELLTGGGQAATLWNRGTENRIQLWWTGESYEIYTRIRIDQVIGNLMRSSNPSSVSFFNFLSAGFDDWYARGSLGMFKALVGNCDHRGRTPEYAAGFHEFTRNRQDFFGIHFPDIFSTPSLGLIITGAVSDSTESLNLRSAFKHGNNDYRRYGSNPFWLFEMGFKDLIGIPLFFEVFGDMADMTLPDGDPTITNSGWNKLSGGIRISGDAIANLITFDAQYRLKGGSPSSFDGYKEMEDPSNPGSFINNNMDKQPSGKGRMLHHFGLYGNFSEVIKGLGISFGFTGMIRTYEDYFQITHFGFETGDEIPGRTLTFSSPFYSGIDLRINYTGLEDRLGITFSNNVSFASATGTDNEKEATTNFVVMLAGGNNEIGPIINPNGQVSRVLGKDNTQSWLSLYNALAVSYKLTNRLTCFFNIANRFGQFTEKTMDQDLDPTSLTNLDYIKPATTIYMRNDLMSVLGLTYLLSSNVTFHSGVSFRYISTSETHEGAFHEQVQVKTQDMSRGTMTIAVPLWMRITF